MAIGIIHGGMIRLRNKALPGTAAFQQRGTDKSDEKLQTNRDEHPKEGAPDNVVELGAVHQVGVILEPDKGFARQRRIGEGQADGFQKRPCHDDADEQESRGDQDRGKPGLGQALALCFECGVCR